MQQVTSADFQKNFGTYKRAALTSPVGISVHSKPTLVLISADHYNRLVSGSEAAAKQASATPEAQPVSAAVAPAIADLATPPEAAPVTPPDALVVPAAAEPSLKGQIEELERIAGGNGAGIHFRDDPISGASTKK